MAGVKLCGELNPESEDQKCVRRERHSGRHRARRGATWANRTPRPKYQRYLPPDRRGEGAPALFPRRYKRPGVDDSTFRQDDNHFSSTED